MRKLLLIILLLCSFALADDFTSDLLPTTTNFLDFGTQDLQWRNAWGDGVLDWDTITDGTFSTTAGVGTGLVSLTDGSASWLSSNLFGFGSISGTTLTDTVLSINSGSISNAVNGTFSGTITGGILTDGTTTITGGNYTGVGNLTGSDIDISAGTGSFTGSGTSTFGQIIDSGLTPSLGVYTDVSSQLTSTAPSSGVLGYWSRAGTTISTANAGDDLLMGGDIGMGRFDITNLGNLTISDGVITQSWNNGTPGALICALSLTHEVSPATPAINTAVAIDFNIEADDGVIQTGAIDSTIKNVGSGTEISDLDLWVLTGGTLTKYLTIDGSAGEIVLNQDIRIKSGSITSDSGIVNFGATDVSIDGTGSVAGVAIRQGADSLGLQINGFDDRSGDNATLNIDVSGRTHLLASGLLFFGGQGTDVGFVGSTSFSYLNDKSCQFGSSSSTNSSFRHSTSQTNDSLLLTLSPPSNGSDSLVIVDSANFNYQHPKQINPTIFLHSATNSTTEWISFTHDQTNGVIETGTGHVRFKSSIGLENFEELRFYDDGANYVGFKAPALTANQIWTLPTADGDPGAVLTTDGAGVTSWTDNASEKTWAFMSRDASSGTNYIGGFYKFGATDNDFNPVITFGTANVAYSAHFFLVQAAGAGGGTDTVVRVNGTTIDDQGNRVTGVNVDIIVDDAGAANTYYETTQKWIGQISIVVLSGPDLLMNYGFTKYWDNNNTDFKVVGVEATWLGAKADANPDIHLHHHKATGWTYNAGAEPTTPAEIGSMANDLGTEKQIAVAQEGAWKRDNFNTNIMGSTNEGTIIELTTTTNRTYAIGNFLVRVTPQ